MTLRTKYQTFSGIGIMGLNQDSTDVHLHLSGKLFRIAVINDYLAGYLSDQTLFTLDLEGIVDDVYTIEKTIPKEITGTGRKKVVVNDYMLSYEDAGGLTKRWEEQDTLVRDGVIKMMVVKSNY